MSNFIKCPKCGGDIRPSGFSGHLFCWGKCSHYLNEEEIKAAKEAAQQVTPADGKKLCGFCGRDESADHSNCLQITSAKQG